MPIPGTGAGRVRRSARTIRLGHEVHAGQQSSSVPVELSDADVVAFLSLSTELFGEFGPSGALVWANAATATTLGYTEDELRQVPLDQLVHPDDLVSTESDVPHRSDGVCGIGRGVPVASQGRDVEVVRVDGLPFADAGSVYGAARDVTDPSPGTGAVRSGRSACRPSWTTRRRASS